MSDDLIEVSLEDGKYTVREFAPGRFEVLRYGEHWPAYASGPDNLHIALAVEVARLKSVKPQGQAAVSAPRTERDQRVRTEDV